VSQSSFNVRASKSCETAKRFLTYPTTGISLKPMASREKNVVSRASDHLFCNEGAMEDTVGITGK
jgi:hypothetical protein